MGEGRCRERHPFIGYTKAKEALDQVKDKGWQQCELAHRHALVQWMIGVVGLQEYARIKGYELHLM